MHNSSRISNAVSFDVPLAGEDFSPAEEYSKAIQMFRQQSMTYATIVEYFPGICMFESYWKWKMWQQSLRIFAIPTL